MLYMRHLLADMIIIMVLFNVVLLLIPRTVRRFILFTVKSMYKICKTLISQSITIVKFIYKKGKTIYIDQDKKKEVQKEQPSNVIKVNFK